MPNLEFPSRYVREALRVVQTIYPDAVVAGGVLRDEENCVPATDVDIFIPRELDAGTIIGVFGEDNVRKMDLGNPACMMYEEASRGDLYNVYEIYADCPTRTKIQLMGTAEPMRDTLQFVRRFDFGACQIAFDGEKVYRSPAYQEDLLNGSFTLMNTDSNRTIRRSMHRYGRWQERYPNHALIIPVKFHKFLDPDHPANESDLLVF